MARPTHVLEAGFGSSPDTPVSATVWTDISAWLDVRAGVRISNRGRPDEFADITPAKMALTLDNRDGRFTPGRSASPYWPNVTPGRRIRYAILVPGGGVNHAENPTTANIARWSAGGSVPPAITLSATHVQFGSGSLLVTWGTGGVLPQAGITLRGLAAGKQYTASVYVWVPATHPAVQLVISGGGPVGSASTTFGAFQRISVTFTASANSHTLQVWPTSAPAAGQQVWVNALQPELGPAPTAFVNTAAVFSWRFTGDVVEWPLEFAGGPALMAECHLSASDRFATLGATREFRTLIEEDILDDAPDAYYPLSEPAGAATAADLSGNNQPPLAQANIGAGGGTITFGGTQAQPPYSELTTAVFAPASATNGRYLTARLAPLSPGTASIVAFVATTNAAAVHKPIAALHDSAGNRLALYIDGADQHLKADIYDAAAGVARGLDSGLAINTGATVLVAATMTNPSGLQLKLTLYVNGVEMSNRTDTYSSLAAFSILNVGTVRKSDPLITGLFVGGISHVAVYDYAIAGGPLAALWYSAFQGNGGTTDTFARADKLAGFAGLGSPLYISAGAVFNPRPIGPQEVAGNPVEALAAVERTEDGRIYIAGDGNLVFELRSARFNLSPVLTTDAGHADPGAISWRGDLYGVVNDVTARRGEGAGARAVNTASVAANGRRRQTLELLSGSDADAASVAWWRANSRGTARNRITGVRFSLLNDPSLAAGLLQDGRSFVIRLTGLPSQAPAASLDLVVEGTDETIGEEEWTMDCTCSPAEVYAVWALAVAGRSELGTTTKLAEAT